MKLQVGEISISIEQEAIVEEKASNKDGAQSDPEESSPIWFDETLSEDGLEAQRRLLDARWSDVYGKRDLTADQEFARPIILKYLELRIGIINSLLLVRSGMFKNEDLERLSGTESDMREVLKLVSTLHFTMSLEAFDIRADHQLSPARLFPETTTMVSVPPTAVHFESNEEAITETKVKASSRRRGGGPTHPATTSFDDLMARGTAFNIITKLNSYDRTLKVEDVVEVLGLSQTTVYRLSESGQMPSAMLGGSRVYDPSALAMWVASKEPRIAKAHRQLQKEKEET
jgi:predicted DNA-binding transcriptional regulator AlpA